MVIYHVLGFAHESISVLHMGVDVYQACIISMGDSYNSNRWNENMFYMGPAGLMSSFSFSALNVGQALTLVILNLQNRMILKQGTDGSLWYKVLEKQEAVKFKDLGPEQMMVYQVSYYLRMSCIFFF